MAMDTGNAMPTCGINITSGKISFLDVLKYIQKCVTVNEVAKSSQNSLALHCV